MNLVSIFFKSSKKLDYTKTKIKRNDVKLEISESKDMYPFLSTDIQNAMANSIRDIEIFKLSQTKQRLLTVRDGIVKLSMMPQNGLDMDYYHLSSFLSEPISSAETKGYVCKK